MLFTAISVITLAQNASLTFSGDAFSIKTGAERFTVPVSDAGPKPARVFDFRDKTARVYWDGKKLTVRKGTYVRSTDFPDLSTAPRLFSKEQIQDTVARIESGDRSRAVSAITGHELIGEKLYLLLRWNSVTQGPVFEALISFDLAQPKPWFAVHYKMPGVSLADRKAVVADELFRQDNRLVTVARQDGRWGLATWDLEQEFVRFFPLGSGIARYSIPDQNIQRLYFIERTNYNSWLAGQVVLGTQERTNIAESTEKVSFISADPPIVRIDSTDRCRIRWVDTGLEREFKAWTAAKFTKAGLLTWYPARQPSTASLFATGTWKSIADWAKK